MAQALVNEFKGSLESVTLLPSSGGRYEITVDGNLVYSKAETKQHIADEDAIRLVKLAV